MGQAGTNVEQLADPYLTNQVPDRAVEKPPDGAGVVGNARYNSTNLLTGLAIGRIVVLTT